MTQLAKATPRKFELGDLETIPVDADSIIYEGAILGDDGSGYARQMVQGDPFLGIADETVDNSDGSAGDYEIRSRKRGNVVLPVTGVSGVGDVGAVVYAADSNTATLTATSNTPIGRISRIISGTTCVVQYDAFGGVIVEVDPGA